MEGRKALVTGAGTGIGRGIALVLGKAGYDVAVHYRGSRTGAEDAVRTIREKGGRARAFQADLSDVRELDRLFHESFDFLGGLDLYVNNSGVTRKALFSDSTPDLFDLLVNVDLRSAYFGVQKAANFMVERGSRGSIVVVSSNNAMMQRRGLSLYGMMKAALLKMTKHAAIEYARHGIRVNSIAPGWTATERVLRDNDENEVIETIPLKRMLTPEEVGKIVLFYDSPAALSITGNCIVADGGFILLSGQPSSYGL